MCFVFGWVLGQNNCESSIPKSVNKPVKCVVLTTALEIFVTKEFCSPMANNSEHTIRSEYWVSDKFVNRPIDVKIRHSISVGRKNTFSFLLSLNFSIKKLDKKEPNKKEKI